jgi:hypothetical protein
VQLRLLPQVSSSYWSLNKTTALDQTASRKNYSINYLGLSIEVLAKSEVWIRQQAAKIIKKVLKSEHKEIELVVFLLKFEHPYKVGLGQF